MVNGGALLGRGSDLRCSRDPRPRPRPLTRSIRANVADDVIEPRATTLALNRRKAQSPVGTIRVLDHQDDATFRRSRPVNDALWAP